MGSCLSHEGQSARVVPRGAKPYRVAPRASEGASPAPRAPSPTAGAALRAAATSPSLRLSPLQVMPSPVRAGGRQLRGGAVPEGPRCLSETVSADPGVAAALATRVTEMFQRSAAPLLHDLGDASTALAAVSQVYRISSIFFTAGVYLYLRGARPSRGSYTCAAPPIQWRTRSRSRKR
jgi:hypothetical protein